MLPEMFPRARSKNGDDGVLALPQGEWPKPAEGPSFLSSPEGCARNGAIERLVLQASRDVKVLASLTPIDAHRERERLVAELEAGREPVPRWRYGRVTHDDLRRALDEAERALALDAETSLDRLYLDRVRELSLEAEICAAAGTPRVARLARERFAPADEDVAQQASALCASWLAQSSEGLSAETLASDDDDPRSLLMRMRAEVGRRHLPFIVVIRPTLASLAATGDGVILVAPGRPVTEEEATRTVLHEVVGHACPRARSQGSSVALVRVGTAHGVDDQEGRALLLEERAGLLGTRRRRHLAARHRAYQAMACGAAFADVARELTAEHALDPLQAVIVAERVFRGGDGTHPGLGRERVYLEAFVRVRAHLALCPEDEATLAAGQVAVEAAGALRGLLGRGDRRRY
jgi:hypothetical protein